MTTKNFLLIILIRDIIQLNAMLNAAPIMPDPNHLNHMNGSKNDLKNSIALLLLLLLLSYSPETSINL